MNEDTHTTGQTRIGDRINYSIDWLSNTIAKYRGLPMIVSLGLIVINFLLAIIDSLAGGVPVLSFLIATDFFLHLGLIVGLIGILAAEPLGRG